MRWNVLLETCNWSWKHENWSLATKAKSFIACSYATHSLGWHIRGRIPPQAVAVAWSPAHCFQPKVTISWKITAQTNSEWLLKSAFTFTSGDLFQVGMLAHGCLASLSMVGLWEKKGTSDVSDEITCFLNAVSQRSNVHWSPFLARDLCPLTLHQTRTNVDCWTRGSKRRMKRFDFGPRYVVLCNCRFPWQVWHKMPSQAAFFCPPTSNELKSLQGVQNCFCFLFAFACFICFCDWQARFPLVVKESVN